MNQTNQPVLSLNSGLLFHGGNVPFVDEKSFDMCFWAFDKSVASLYANELRPQMTKITISDKNVKGLNLACPQVTQEILALGYGGIALGLDPHKTTVRRISNPDSDDRGLYDFITEHESQLQEKFGEYTVIIWLQISEGHHSEVYIPEKYHTEMIFDDIYNQPTNPYASPQKQRRIF